MFKREGSRSFHGPAAVKTENTRLCHWGFEIPGKAEGLMRSKSEELPLKNAFMLRAMTGIGFFA